MTVTEEERHKSLQDLEGVDWGEPTFPSHLVTTCHRLHRTPLQDFTVEDLRIMIGQQMGLPYLVPLALERLRVNPFASRRHSGRRTPTSGTPRMVSSRTSGMPTSSSVVTCQHLRHGGTRQRAVEVPEAVRTPTLHRVSTTRRIEPSGDSRGQVMLDVHVCGSTTVLVQPSTSSENHVT